MKTLGEIHLHSQDAKDRYLDRATEFAAHQLSMKVDMYVKLHIQPKPRWLPDFIWLWLLNKLLVLD